MTAEHRCAGGWVCEQHPEQKWPHKIMEPCSCGAPHFECPGPAMPCTFADCEFWRDGVRLAR